MILYLLLGSAKDKSVISPNLVSPLWTLSFWFKLETNGRPMDVV